MDSKPALSYNEWIKYAEKKGYIITPEKFLELKTGIEYDVYEIDYIRFLAYEYGKNTESKPILSTNPNYW